ncbi:MAG: hypothetical protein AAF800_03105 [Planctomycetota bacterium]
MTRRTFRITPAALAVAGLLLALGLTGCSKDRHVYRSTAVAPKAVSLVSSETGNTLKTWNVPVGQQLVLDFSRGGRGGEEWSSPDVPADRVNFAFYTNESINRYGNEMKGGRRLESGSERLTGEHFIINVDILDPQVTASP